MLEVSDLSVRFDTDDGPVHAVDRMSFTLEPGEVLGIVGESGCGKSVTCMSLTRLLPETATITGRAVFDGADLLALSPRRLRRVRGREISYVFQEPMTSLNPVFTVGHQITEVLRRHFDVSRGEARRKAIELLRLVRIPAAERRIDEYPHQLSGGMRQRVMIAIALACDPELLIADEPTTALDVTIQAQILDLMRDLKAETGAAIILITHDLGVVAEVCDEVAVMYAGQIVERAPVATLFEEPQHPYTLGLMGSIPRLDERAERLATIEGALPDMTAPPRACRFAPRCPFVEERCTAGPPPVVTLASGHWSRCFRAPLQDLVS